MEVAEFTPLRDDVQGQIVFKLKLCYSNLTDFASSRWFNVFEIGMGRLATGRVESLHDGVTIID